MFPNDATTRNSLIEFLKEKKYDYNTYTPSEEKMVNVLIKGLDHIDDEEVIMDELQNKGYAPIKIQKYVTGYMRKNDIKSNLWLIVLQPNTDTQELFRIRAIDHAIVKFDFLRKPKVIQCRRCQRFDHSASNCNLPYRCVKCTERHEPGKCKCDSKNNKFKPKCVNCNGNHTANDAKNCEIFKKAIENRANKKAQQTKQTNTKSEMIKSSLKTSQSYADRVKTNKQKKTSNSDNTNLNMFIDNQNKMLSEFMASIQKMQKQFIASFHT